LRDVLFRCMSRHHSVTGSAYRSGDEQLVIARKTLAYEAAKTGESVAQEVPERREDGTVSGA
jgi:hypothetical protein